MKRAIDTEQFEIDRRSDLVIRFQRTMRRLYVLRSFAKDLKLEFDIDQLDIATLTRRSAKGRVDWTKARVSKDALVLIEKQDYFQ